jgi:hypothetical protein
VRTGAGPGHRILTEAEGHRFNLLCRSFAASTKKVRGKGGPDYKAVKAGMILGCVENKTIGAGRVRRCGRADLSAQSRQGSHGINHKPQFFSLHPLRESEHFYIVAIVRSEGAPGERRLRQDKSRFCLRPGANFSLSEKRDLCYGVYHHEPHDPRRMRASDGRGPCSTRPRHFTRPLRPVSGPTRKIWLGGRRNPLKSLSSWKFKAPKALDSLP